MRGEEFHASVQTGQKCGGGERFGVDGARRDDGGRSSRVLGRESGGRIDDVVDGGGAAPPPLFRDGAGRETADGEGEGASGKVVEDNGPAGRLRAGSHDPQITADVDEDSVGASGQDFRRDEVGCESFADPGQIEADVCRKRDCSDDATLGHDILFFAVPIVNGSTLIGALRLTFPTSYVDARIERGWWALICIGLVGLLIAFFVSLRLARQVTIPIERLAEASARVGGGNLDSRAEVPRGPPELRGLTEQFNTTTARLERLVHAQQGFVADTSHQLRTPSAALRLRHENLESEVSQMPDPTADVARGSVS